MKPLPRFLLLLAGWFPASVLATDAPDGLVVPVPSATSAATWRLETAGSDQASISSAEDCLIIAYTVAINRTHQIGHETYPTGSFDLLLKQPLPLPAGSSRIAFEALGNEWKSWQNRQNQVRLRPLLRDEQGEVLVYNAFPDERFHFAKDHPATKNDSGRWRKWQTRPFQTSEAGAATQDVFESRAEKGNNFPDGALTLLGFEVEVRSTAPGARTGRLVLGDCEVLGGKARPEGPWFYADAVCTQKGDYRLGYEVTAAFQGPPIRSTRHDFRYDPENLASRRQRLAFDLGPSGNYWISYRLIDAAGKVAASDYFRSQVYDLPGTPPPAVDPATAPAVGFLRINPLAHTRGVYEADPADPRAPLDVTVRVFAADAATGGRTLQWEVLAYEFPETLDQGSSPVGPAAAGGFTDLTVRVVPRDRRDAYRLKVRVVDAGGHTIDEVLYHLGRKTVFPRQDYPRPSALSDREFIKKGAYNRVTLTKLSSVRFKSEDEAVAYYAARLDEIRKITPHVTYCIDVRDIQVLPGVYNFNLLDRLLDAAAARGMAFTLRFGHIDDEGEYTWQTYSRQLNADGREIPEHYYGGFAVTDTTYTQTWLDAFRAMHDHFGAHPAFQGYYLLQPAGEFTVSDKPWEGLVSDYSPPMRAGFRDWLRDEAGLSLEQLNRRWKTGVKSWDEVAPPQPDYSLGQMPDLRPSWVDFCRFKAWLNKNYWPTRATKAIRAFDPWRVVITYSDPRMAEGLSDYGHNGGNHYFENIGAYQNAWYGRGTGWITEPHQPNKWTDYGDPKERGWVLDWSLWIGLAQAGAGGANLHVYYHPKEVGISSHYGGDMGYDRMQRFFPLTEELHDIEMKRPPEEVAFLSDPNTLFTKHRTTFTPRQDDLKRWGELLDRDNVSYARLTGDIADGALKTVKLVVTNPLDEVLSGANLVQLARAVREDGRRLVMTANTGKYSPERPGEEFVLLKDLGIEPPSGAYVVGDTGVTATAVDAVNPLFGPGETIRFFSLADLKRDLDSEQVKKRENFWTYPYRWLPLTDYFGYYPANTLKSGRMLARFANGAPAVSLHRAGKGEVVVFWGLPDYKKDNLPGFLARLATWAGAGGSVSTNPLPHMLEAANPRLNRHYALIYNDEPGRYRQRIDFLPDGDWFVDDPVSDQRLGRVSGATARERGLDLDFDETRSPLKVLRFIPAQSIRTSTGWPAKYPNLDDSGVTPIAK